MNMTDLMHRRAFSLYLLSQERLLSDKERAFIEKHLKTCEQCTLNVRIHARLQADFRSQERNFHQINLQQFLPLVEIVNSLKQRKKLMRKAAVIQGFAQVCLIIVLFVAVLWIFRTAPPIQSLPFFGGSRAQKTALAPSSIPSALVTRVGQFAPTPASTSQRTEVITYTVAPGDTIVELADRFNLKPETILWSNYKTLGDGCNQSLLPGKELYILPVDGVYYEWQQGDDLNAVASKLRVLPEDIINWPGNHLVLGSQVDLSHPFLEPGIKLVVPGGQLDFYNCNATPHP